MQSQWSGRSKTAFAGLGYSPVARRWDLSADSSLGALTVQAGLAALDDAGLTPSDIDGVFTSPMPLGGLWGQRPIPEGMTTQFSMSDNLEDGISSVSADWLRRNLDIGSEAVMIDTPKMFSLTNYAVDALLSGRCKNVLVFRALPSFPGRYRQEDTSATTFARGVQQFEVPFGFTGPSYHAMYFQRYLWKYSRDHAELAPFAVRNRANGLRCDYSFYAAHRPVTLTTEEYLSSPWITEPLSMHDCDMPVMVAVAFILTTSERARDLRQPPVYVVHQGGADPIKRSTSYTLEDFEAQHTPPARAMFSDSGFTQADMDFIQLYDGYLSITPFFAEAFGFAEAGDGMQFLGSPDAEIGARQPVNTSGGNNGSGRSHGASHIYDTVLQLRGQATNHQVEGARLGLCHVGPPIGWGAQILSNIAV